MRLNRAELNADRLPVITGVGVVSAFGMGRQVFFDGLAAGRCAISDLTHFDVSGMPVRIGGAVTWPDASLADGFNAMASIDARPDRWLAFEQAGYLRDRKGVFALLAAQEAWQQADMAQHPNRAQHADIVMALGLEQAFLDDFAPLFDGQQLDWRRPPMNRDHTLRFRSDIDWPIRLLTSVLGLGGEQIINVSACAAGALSVAQAAARIRRGQSQLVLCGAADSMLNPLGLGGMARLGAPSQRHAHDACKPFDRRRDGLVIGEGAACFVLESATHARQRGATPLAAVLGWGSTQDAYRATAPRPDGRAARLAMQKALDDAGLSADSIGYLNAHGTGTVLNDLAEALAIRDTFGRHTDELLVSSIKGAVGHLMAASGAIELAACLLPWSNGCLPGTANHRERDPACQINVIGENAITADVDYVMSNSFGFGGQNASVILGRV